MLSLLRMQAACASRRTIAMGALPLCSPAVIAAITNAGTTRLGSRRDSHALAVEIGVTHAATSSLGELAGTSKCSADELSWKKFRLRLADSRRDKEEPGTGSP